jgi:hypothetical protein
MSSKTVVTCDVCGVELSTPVERFTIDMRWVGRPYDALYMNEDICSPACARIWLHMRIKPFEEWMSVWEQELAKEEVRK